MTIWRKFVIINVPSDGGIVPLCSKTSADEAIAQIGLWYINDRLLNG